MRRLREKYPYLLIIMNHGTEERLRLGKTKGIEFPRLLDGVHQEGVYVPAYDTRVEDELLRWQRMGLRPGGRPFWIGTTDYVSSCANTDLAKGAFEKSRARGFNPYASDAANGLNVLCYWPF